MKIKRFAIAGLALLLGFAINAFGYQEKSGDAHYYFGGEKIFLEMSTRFLVVQVKDGVDSSDFANKLMFKYTTPKGNWPRAKAFSIPPYEISFCIGTSAGVLDKKGMRDVIKEIRQMPEVKYAGPVYFIPTDVKERILIAMDEFIVKFGGSVTKEGIENINDKFGVEIARMSGDSYVLRAKEPNKTNALEMANKYIESGEVEIKYASPNFIRFILR